MQEQKAPGKYFIRGAGKDEEEASGRREAEGATKQEKLGRGK